ncbi:MAG: GNAT family N-acetyltransferase [Flavobacteriaceae bacterium]
MITIREAKNNDAEVLALLGRVTYNESHGHYIDNKTHLLNYNNTFFSVTKVLEELQIPNNLIYLIYVDNSPIGYIKLVLNATNNNLASTNVCKLERLYILNDFIGQNIGSKAMNHINKTATELNFDELWLAVYIKNTKAIKFYERNGFSKKGNIIFRVGDSDFDNYVLSKKL